MIFWHSTKERKASIDICLPYSPVVLGPLRSVIPDLHSDENEEDSEEEDDNDMDSDLERPLHTQMTHRHRR